MFDVCARIVIIAYPLLSTYPMAFPPIDSTGLDGTFVVASMIFLSGIASVSLAVVAVLAFNRRRTPPYFFVASALVVLAAKAFVGGLTLAGMFELRTHHVIEHGLDFVMAVMLIGAVYVARSPHRCEKLDWFTEGSSP